jgi:hypothetical protein
MNSVLSDLAGSIREQSISVEQYLQQLRAHQIINPFRYPGNWRIGDPMPEEFLDKKGIRRVIVDHVHFGPAEEDPGAILGRCSLVELADWTELVDNGAWDSLYSKWIKPLRRRDFQFIFHLGDVAYKPVFGIDEVLDVIGDYSSCGQVTLILDTHEADTLWCRLNGIRTDGSMPGTGAHPDGGNFGTGAHPDGGMPTTGAWSGCGSSASTARDRWLFLFNTMSIDFLIVLQAGHAMQFSREGQFNLTGPPPVGIGGVINARIRFSAGYQLGLLLQLDAPHCTVLGLAVAGAYGKLSSGSSAQLLVEYLQVHGSFAA